MFYGNLSVKGEGRFWDFEMKNLHDYVPVGEELAILHFWFYDSPSIK